MNEEDKEVDYQRLYTEEMGEKKVWRQRCKDTRKELMNLKKEISELYCYKVAYKLHLDVEDVKSVKQSVEYRLDCPFWAGSGVKADPWRALRDEEDIDIKTFTRAEELLRTWK